jgi:TonB family protein
MRRISTHVGLLGVLAACWLPGRAPSTDIARARAAVVPTYPDLLRSAGVEGDVVVDVAIDSAGQIDHARTKTLFSAHDLFKMSVLRAIDTTAWQPARTRGVAIPSVRRDTFSFVLKRDSTDACPQASEHRRRICGVSITRERRSVS